jgi:D-alanyl-lipoteichoic acid acyltransferase DltB (MBOAT superfamily)
MLFNSFEFVLAFLPLALAAFFFAGRRLGPRSALAALVVASLVYYGWWSPRYLLLIAASICANYLLGRRLARGGRPAARRALATFGIALDLAALAWFKYAAFLAETLGVGDPFGFDLRAIVLPIGISFFTFQQIAYLVDAYRGHVGDHGFLDYVLFVTFFPQLVAGPIVHHGEVMPQFARRDLLDWSGTTSLVGVTLFTLGLFKKVAIADPLSLFANPVFDAADRGFAPSALDAWVGTLAYTFQIYFDFSGYCDMACGLALLFGVRLPINFDSPYRARNAIEFWRRWHMTLSRFLRDYVYVPLGGNRRGRARRYANLLATMLIGGLWHGAGWNFVLWGGVHGAFLVLNHGFRHLRGRVPGLPRPPEALAHALSVGLTFLAVASAWTLFRAETLAGAVRVLRSLADVEGLAASRWETADPRALCLLAASAVVVFAFPNAYQWLHRHRPALTRPAEERACLRLEWRPSALHVLPVAGMGVVALLLIWIGFADEFLYYQF